MNIHETYVSLETAKLLKQAGFDWECEEFWMRYIDDDGDEIGYTDEFYLKSGNSLNWNDKVHSMSYDKPDTVIRFSAPTLAIAQKWLREVKGWNIDIITNREHIVIFYECDCIDKNVRVFKPQSGNDTIPFLFDTYELALEAGIKKCLIN